MIGVLRVSKPAANLTMSRTEKANLRNLQNMVATLFLLFKERSRYHLSDVALKEFVNKSRMNSLVTYYLASSELSELLIRLKKDLCKVLKAEDVAVLVYNKDSKVA